VASLSRTLSPRAGGVPVRLRDTGVRRRLASLPPSPTRREFVLSLLSPAQAEEALSHLTHQFTHWRQSRTTPRGRIPKSLWAQAVTLALSLSCTRVAKQLGLTPQALKRRRDALSRTPALTPPPQAPHFVEVTAAWRPPTTEVEVQRPDGTRMRITYSEAAPLLVPLLHTFLEPR
jgi:hypothetical protein